MMLINVVTHLLTEKLTFWGERKDYFHYLSEGLGSLKTLDIPIKRVQGMNEVYYILISNMYISTHCASIILYM